jgi:outer membrane protein TolC
VARSPGLRAADAQVDRSRRARSEADSYRYPRLDAGSALTRGDGPVYAFASLLDQRSFTQSNFDVDTLNHPGYVTNIKSYLRAGVPLFTGYELQSAGKMAELQVAQMESVAAAARQSLRLAVWEAGIQSLQARAFSTQLAERVRSSTEEVQSAQKLRAKGLVLGSDFFAAEGAVLLGLQAWQIQIEKMGQAAQDSLAVLLNQDPGRFSVAGSLQSGGPPLPTLQDLFNHGRVQRSDVKTAALQADQADVAAFKEKSTFWPTLDAMAQAETNTEDFSSNPSNRLIMLRAEWALGDPSYVARRKKAEDESRSGRQRLAALEEQARVDIVHQYRRYEAARDSLPIFDQTAAKARQSLDLFRPLYREGRQSILDVLRAEEALARAEYMRLETLASLHLQKARTLAAAGILDEGALGALSASLEKPR